DLVSGFELVDIAPDGLDGSGNVRTERDRQRNVDHALLLANPRIPRRNSGCHNSNQHLVRTCFRTRHVINFKYLRRSKAVNSGCFHSSILCLQDAGACNEDSGLHQSWSVRGIPSTTNCVWYSEPRERSTALPSSSHPGCELTRS